MKTQLFVRTPTNYCDYSLVALPKIVVDTNLINSRITRSYDLFSLQSDGRLMYIAINMENCVFTGAWLNIKNLANEGLVDEKYRKRMRNKKMQEEYFAFVGFAIEKNSARQITVNIEEKDYIDAFNGIIEQIWERKAEETYDLVYAWLYLNTEKYVEDATSESILLGAKKRFISNKKPTIEILNNIVNAMLNENAPIGISFCSGFKNSRSFDDEKRFELGCTKYKRDTSIAYRATKKVFFEDSEEKNEVVIQECMLGGESNENEAPVYQNNEATLIENQPLEKESKDETGEMCAKVINNEEPAKLEEASNSNEEQTELIIDSKEQANPTKEQAHIIEEDKKESKPNNNKKKRKKSKTSFLKRIWWFLTTDIRDLREGYSTDEN